MNGGIFLLLNVVAFFGIAFAINIIVTKTAIKNKTWIPYGAPDLIAGFAWGVSLTIMVIWLSAFFGLGFGEYIQ